MKIENIFALVVVVLAPCLATVAQTTTTTTTAPAPTAPAPTAPAPSAPVPAPSTTPGDTLVKQPDASVVAHGTAPEMPPPTSSFTNEPGTDEVLDQVAFDAIPLPDAVRALANGAGLNITFDPKLLNTVGPDGHSVPISPPNITEKWKKVTSKQALSSLLDNWGWQLVLNPGSPIARVTAKDPAALEPLVTTVVELDYSNPTNILTEVQPTLSTRSSIISDPRTHKLIVRTTERELPGVKELIAKLDTAIRQVLIEAKIVETQKDIGSAKGIDWTGTLGNGTAGSGQHFSFGNGTTSGTVTSTSTSATVPAGSSTTTGPGGAPITTTTGGGIGTTVNNVTSLLTTFPTSGGSGGLSLNTARGFSPATAFLNADGVSALLQFMNTDADTKSISFPRTVALDGVQTVLAVVKNIPIFEQQQSAPAAGASQGLATVLPNYDKEVRGTILNEVGVKLTVIPRIAGPTNVLMDLRPEISSEELVPASDVLSGQNNTSPIFDRRSILTQAAVPSGYTLVLGGLESDSDSKGFNKVPFFGDIPALGYLFRSDNKSRSRDTILIFVTPTIIQDSDFQPGNTRFLKSRNSPISTAPDSSWDTGEPYDWTKPKTEVTPSYQP